MLIRLLGSQVRIYVSYNIVLVSAQHSALRGCDLVGDMYPTLHYEPSTEVYVPYGFLTCA